jgi:ribosomal protein S30
MIDFSFVFVAVLLALSLLVEKLFGIAHINFLYYFRQSTRWSCACRQSEGPGSIDTHEKKKKKKKKKKKSHKFLQLTAIAQTPKVEKKEKKKELTGRAKRRLQFNKRFVDVPEGQRRRTLLIFFFFFFFFFFLSLSLASTI